MRKSQLFISLHFSLLKILQIKHSNFSIKPSLDNQLSQTAMLLADGQADGTFFIAFSTHGVQPKIIFQCLPEKQD